MRYELGSLLDYALMAQTFLYYIYRGAAYILGFGYGRKRLFEDCSRL
jgi:hypothetical protein